MGSSSEKQETTQHQASAYEPWAAAKPTLNGILGGINSQVGNFNPTAAENNALNTLKANASNTPNYAPQATSLANDLMAGGPDRTGMLDSAYTGYQQQMSPYLSADYLDPMKSPGMQSILDTIRNDVGNSVNGMFAGAGRDMSGMHQQSLARGIAQGEAVPLLAQYNANVAAQQGAANSLFNAGGQTAGALSALDQNAFSNRVQGLDVGINGINQAANAGATNMLGAEAAARGLPLQNLGMLSALTVPIAGLGGSSASDMNGTTTKTSQANPWQTAIGGALGAAGLFGGSGLFGANGAFGANGFFGRKA